MKILFPGPAIPQTDTGWQCWECQQAYHIGYGESVSDYAQDCEACGETVCNECLEHDEHWLNCPSGETA